jgi:3-oxoacyl-[acyl-carrier-protein] synthase-1
MVDGRGDPFVVAIAPYLESKMRGESRIVELALIAAQEAVAAAQAAVQTPLNIPAIVGLPESRPGLGSALVSRLGASLTRGLANGVGVSRVQLLPNGNSSGLMAIEAGCRVLREGGVTFVLVGGADSYVDADTLEWLDERERLNIPSNAWGFIPGEAAGFCLLCFAETAAHYGIPVLGKVVAIAKAHEPNCIYTETICIGEGLTRAVQLVLGAMRPGAMIDDTICDQNGEAYRADECGFMLARTSEHFVNATDLLTPADCWGDVGAASGPLFVSLAAFAALKGYAKGGLTLLCTSSDSGGRSVLLFETSPIESWSR